MGTRTARATPANTKGQRSGNPAGPSLFRFALAGEIVSTSRHARQILYTAVVEDKRWLIPQAESVAFQLKRAGR